MKNELDRVTNARVSRRTLLKGAGAGVAGVAMAQAGVLRSLAAESESVQDILNVTATVERFGVTFLGAGIESAEQKNFNKPIPAPVLAVLKAARAQEQFHLDFFESAGGRAVVSTFTVPPAALTDYDTFFKAIVVEETVEIAAQLAAIRTYTELQRPDMVKVSFQYAAEEAEHRLLANYALGTRPANDVAFEKAMFTTVGQAADTLKQLGFIGGGGTEVTYPGPGVIDHSNVTNTMPDGPTVACMPGMPQTGGGDMSRTPDAGRGGLQEMLGFLGLFGVGAATVGTLSRRLKAHVDERAETRAGQE